MNQSHVVDIANINRLDKDEIALFTRRERHQEVQCWQSPPDERNSAFYSVELNPCGGVGSVDSKSPASCGPNSSRFGFNAYWSRLCKSFRLQIPNVYIVGFIVAIICGILSVPWRRTRRRAPTTSPRSSRPNGPRRTKRPGAGSINTGTKKPVPTRKEEVLQRGRSADRHPGRKPNIPRSHKATLCP